MTTSEHPRDRLLAAAQRLLRTGGVEAVQARRLAQEVGASTMAVYTHFGGMPELFEAMVREGFGALTAHVAAVPATEDPMMDFFVGGFAYREWAHRNPELYRLMFGLTGVTMPKRLEQDMTVAGTISLLSEAEEAFAVMVRSLDRVRRAGRIDAVDTVTAAGQFLSATHGYVLLEIAGYFEPDGNGTVWVLGPMGLSLMVGLGASRADSERSARAAIAALGGDDGLSLP